MMSPARVPLAFILLLCLALPGASPGADSTLVAGAQGVLKTHCARCHGPEGSAKGGFGYVLDRDRLVVRGKIVPGKPDESELYQRVQKGEMPPPKQQPRPAPDDLAVLRQWIEAGAPGAGPAPGPRAFLADGDVLRLVLTDLRATEPRQRRFSRYLTLAHLYNAGFSEDELHATRQAVAKLLNSLSWHPRIGVPEPIDPAKTILRLDLRRYEWTARTWDRLADAYPYRSGTGGEEARAVAAAAGCDQPVLRADWFVATGSRPPLYHDLLQLPGSDRELERQLRVDVPNDLQEETAARAGFNGSGVSRNNRLIERHDAAYGAYWRSYDFSDNTERQNLFEHPLGPLPGQSSFTPAGGEILFHLPNGLQGYMLVDGSGRRLDRAPVEIVSDPRRPDRTVETGLSCMSCHVRGLIPKADQVRAHVLKNPNGFSQADVTAVKALYPPVAMLRALMQEDEERFVKALAKTGVQPDDAEPVSAVAQHYEAPLDLAAAAAEVGLPAEDFANRLRNAPALSRSLGSLLVKGGTVQRSAFQDAFTDAARALHPGRQAERATPVAVRPDDVRPFAGHTGYITSVAFSPDGRRAVSGSADRTLRLWDVGGGKELRCFTGHTDEVLSVAFAPDGRRVLSGGRDRTLRLWDAGTGNELQCFTGHTDHVSAVAFAPDGRRLLSGSWDRTVRLWDAESGKELQRIPGHSDRVSAVAFSPDGHSALSASDDGTVRLWDLTAGRAVRRFEGHTGQVYAVAFSPDGRRAISGGNDCTVRLWDVAGGKELQRFTGHADIVVAVAFSPDGRRALSGSSRYRGYDPFVRVWDVETGEELHHFGGGGSIWSPAFSPDGTAALSANSDKTLRLWKFDK